MSRSYKKSPWVNDHKRRTTKENKQIANRRFRRMAINDDRAPSRSFHKRYNESWDISDYCWRWTKEDAKQAYANGSLNNYIYNHYPTMQDWLNYWAKCCERKQGGVLKWLKRTVC